MHGQILELELDAPSLRDNPLGDPSRRPLVVYVPPGGAAGRPAVYFLHGFTGSGRSWLNASPFTPTVPERIDALVAAGEIPPIVGVFPDGATGLGGTQWIDAPAVGRYQSYVAVDVVAAVEARLGTVPRREGRALAGKSSGGYGALAMARDCPETFAHVACHSGDAYFEYCYLADLPKAAGALLASGGDVPAWLEAMRRRGARHQARPRRSPGPEHARDGRPLLARARRAARPGAPLRAAVRADPRPEVWARWLEHDPVRFVPGGARRLPPARQPSTWTAARATSTTCAGARGWWRRRSAPGGVAVVHEEFEDGHMGINYRYDASLRRLAPRLASGA